MKYAYFHSRFVRWVLCGVAGLGLTSSVQAHVYFSVDFSGSTRTWSYQYWTGTAWTGWYGGTTIPTNTAMPWQFTPNDMPYRVRMIDCSGSGWSTNESPQGGATLYFPCTSYDPRSNGCIDLAVTNASSDSQFVEVGIVPTNVVGSLTGAAATGAAAAFMMANPVSLKRLVLGAGKVFRITPQSLAFNAAIAAGVYLSTKFFDSLGVQNVTSEGYQPLTAPTTSSGCWTGSPLVLNPGAKTDNQKLVEAARAPQTDGTNIVDESHGWATNYMGVLERILQQEKDGPTNRPSQSATEQANSQGQAGRDAIESTRSGVAGLANTGGGGGGPVGPLGVTVPDSNPEFWRKTITLAPVVGMSAGPSFSLSWNPLGGPITSQIQAIVNALMRYGSWLAMVAFCWKITINHARDAYSVKEAGSAANIPVISTGLAQACALVMTVAVAAIPAFFVSWMAGAGATYSGTFQSAVTGASSVMLNEAVNLLWHTVPVAVVLVHLGIAYVYKLNVWLLYIVCGGVVKFCTG